MTIIPNILPSDKLAEILPTYGVPDPSIVGTLPKGGRELSFVGHAEITRILIEIDPCWWWEPAAMDGGLPAITVANGMAHMGGTLYIHGVGRFGIGSVDAKKPDLYKELASDFLRNAAMRFGIALSLWSRAEWDDLKTTAPAPAAPDTSALLSEEQAARFEKYCNDRGLNPFTVYREAGLKLGKATVGDMKVMKDTADRLVAEKESGDASPENS